MHPLCTSIMSGYSLLCKCVILTSFNFVCQKYAERL